MDQEKRDIFRNLAMISSMGISIALAIGIGAWFGLTLDRWFNTKPYFFYIFLLLGIAAGFNNIYIIVRREIRKDEGCNK